MKLKIGDKVYLQKYEVSHILHDSNAFPSSILDETFDDGKCKAFIMNGPADGFQFKCVYEKPENVKWLMDQSWIVDYDEYAEMSLAELEALWEHLRVKRSTGIDEFNAKEEAYKKTHFDEASEKFDKLGHKITSIGYLIRLRRGEVEFIFPVEYRNRTTITSAPQKKPGFFARLFGRSTQ